MTDTPKVYTFSFNRTLRILADSPDRAVALAASSVTEDIVKQVQAQKREAA